jgi:hypothetical protein
MTARQIACGAHFFNYREPGVLLLTGQLTVGVLNIFLLRRIREVVLVNLQKIDFGLETKIDGAA